MDEPEKSLMLTSELDILSNWDATATRANGLELCQRSSTLVTAAERSEDQTFLVFAWACYSFYETKITGTGGKKKWQLTRIIAPKTGVIPPYADSWAEFCTRHLRKATTTVSGYKSIWDTYVVKLEIDVTRLSLAGKSKLLVAQKLIKDMYPGVNKELMDKLLDPEVSLKELQDLVHKLRRLMDGKDDPEEEEEPKGAFQGDQRYDKDMGIIYWTGHFIYKDRKVPLNELTFDVLGPDVVGKGVPEDLVIPLMDAIAEALGGS